MKNSPFNLSEFEQQAKALPRNSVSQEGWEVFLKATPASVEIAIMEQVGDDGWGGGVKASEVSDKLRGNSGKPVNVRINSPGGLAYDGMQIYNALKAHDGPVTTINEGLAYSAASVIFLAGEKRVVHELSDYGIHRTHGGGWGTANLLLSVVDFVDRLDQHIVNLYAKTTGQSVDQITKWIDGTTQGEMGTMFSGAEALEAGFATEMVSNTPENKAPAEPSKMEELAVKERKQMLPLAIQARRAQIDTMLGRV